METVLRIGAVSTDLVAIEARKAIENGLETPVDTRSGVDEDDENSLGELDELPETGAKVISLHARRLPPDPRPALPDMTSTTGW
ncbi:hypothetical protein [Streptomyces griseocarneus]|uniref:hypothetical protein n=1 Tax=Streptomyces griseocarneus TaxID=51201 RepID=UPI00167CF005|nr:hypothetical protein [Streptomyces griseocarneus]MBZ6478110.1 hypothetical protein [Streptomyces griseocarneus]GHG83686.1 hypothetical protein GCM10018779_66900 [Streptomyces griseocarneus]